MVMVRSAIQVSGLSESASASSLLELVELLPDDDPHPASIPKAIVPATDVARILFTTFFFMM
jgi:hypothetical protein